METALRVADVVRQMIEEVRPRLVQAALTGDRGESRNERHTGNFLSVHDLWLHDRYRELLSRELRSFVYASEEADPVAIGPDPDPDLCVLVDPLDTSELAVRALNGYTHVVVYSRSARRPVVAVIGDIFHHLQLYVAYQSHGDRERAVVVDIAGKAQPLKPAHRSEVAGALVTNCLMRPAQRFQPLAAQGRLLEALGADGRIGVDFGSIGLCHVASGFTDAMVEFAKGFAIWDLMPGHYVLHAAGGVVADLDGRALPLDYGLDSLSDIAAAMNRRQKFVAACDQTLAANLVKLLASSDLA